MFTGALCRPRFAFGVLLVWALCAASSTAQVRPNFSGTWEAVQPPSSGSSSIETIEQRDTTLKVAIERRSTAGPFGMGFFSGDHTYSIGGPEEVRTTDDGIIRTVSVAWDGSTLVFLRTEREGANTRTTREAWSLSADGTTLTRTRHITTWRGATDEESVYKRKR